MGGPRTGQNKRLQHSWGALQCSQIVQAQIGLSKSFGLQPNGGP
jgi:hypothetical protein